jgi:hypothetical protein
MQLDVIRKGIVLGLALALAIGGTALADDLRPDADTLAGLQSSVHLGEVEPGTTRSLEVDFVLACRSSSHLSAGATLAIDAGSTDAPSGGSMVVVPGQVVVPADWPADGDFCTGSESAATTTPARLTITAPQAEGTGYAYTVIFALPEDEPVANTIAVTVYLDVVAPPPADTTDPVLHDLPSDITATTSGDSAAVSWTAPTATDDTDSNPSVTCDPPSGALFPVGITVVTCTATDDAGNDATATFSVTVNRDGVPPADLDGAWDRPLADAVPALVGRAGRTIPLKLTVLDASTPQGPTDVDAPQLTVQPLATCGGQPTGAAVAAGTFTWGDGGWQLNLDTSSLGTGCVRLVASVGDDAAGTADVQLVPETAIPLTGKDRPSRRSSPPW